MKIHKNIPKDIIFIAVGAIAQFGLSFAFSGGSVTTVMIANACFDMIYAAKCAMNREVDLEDFVIKKGVNMMLGVASSIFKFVRGAKICTDTVKNSHFVTGFWHLTHLVKA